MYFGQTRKNTTTLKQVLIKQKQSLPEPRHPASQSDTLPLDSLDLLLKYG